MSQEDVMMMSMENNDQFDFQNKSQHQGGSTLEIQRKLLAKTKTDKVNALMKKIRLINNSPAPQRLHILPPQTNYFKIKYNKKGMVPAGIAEDIYVQFTPNDEYKYYYDCIRIHCEGDKILIPIHAFPVINSKKDEIFPKYVDMGKHLKVGENYSQSINIESNCPVNFEYDIEITKAHPDIQIYPLSGDILGLQTTKIQINFKPISLRVLILNFQISKFTPTTYTTAEAEISFRTTEFDSQSKICRIVGNALPQRAPQKPTFELGDSTTLNKMQQEQMSGTPKYSQEEYSVKKTKSRTLLTGKRENRPSSRAGVKLEKLPEKVMNQSRQSLPKYLPAPTETLKLIGEQSIAVLEPTQRQQSTPQKSTQQLQQNQQQTMMMPTLKNIKLSIEEQQFTQEYRKLEDLEREKGIKFFQCVGDPPITSTTVNSIADKRETFINNKKENMREQDITRYQPVMDEDRVVVSTSLDLREKPKWDAFENNHFAMRRRLVNIFLKNCNKLITRMRAEKRLVKIRVKLREAGVRTREECKKMVAQDWKDALNLRLGDGENEDNIQNIKFSFNFNIQNIKNAQKKLPLEYETNIASFMEKVEANPPISFDDLIPYEPLEQLEFEVQKYQKFPVAQISQFDPIELEKQTRPGCEYESLIKPRRGEPELEKVQQQAFDQQKLLKKASKDIASAAIVNMPATFQKPFDYSIDLIVKQHPTLREYVGLRRQTEIDQDYNLFSSARVRQDPKDEIIFIVSQNSLLFDQCFVINAPQQYWWQFLISCTQLYKVIRRLIYQNS